jgi:hypothetical protein
MTSLGRFFTAGFVSAAVAATVVLLSEPTAMATPTLQASPDHAAPGDSITVSGGGVGSCLNTENMVISVRFVWDNVKELLTYSYDANISNGSFQTQVTVPADASAGEHSVGLECSTATFGVLGSATVQVIPPTSTPTTPTPTPTLQLSPGSAGPGQTVTATGTGFGQCTDAAGEVTSVLLLLWDNRQSLGPVTGSGGEFTASVVVPKDAVDGTYTVVAECYDPAASNATSGPIARQTLTIAVAAATTKQSSPSSTTESSSPSSSAGSSSRSSTATQGSGSSAQTSGPAQSTVPPATSSIPLSRPSPPRLKPAAAGWQPIARVGGAVGILLAVALLVLLGVQSRHAGRPRRTGRLVHEHARVEYRTRANTLTIHATSPLPSRSIEIRCRGTTNIEVKEARP